MENGVDLLIEKLNAFQTGLYPPEKCHLESPEQLISNKAIMLGAFKNDELVGIGAIKPMENYAEIKRMYVDEVHRGEGIAQAILLSLENLALKKNYTIIRLETGSKHFAAQKLYLKMGYYRIQQFGNYPINDVSVLMEKPLRSL